MMAQTKVMFKIVGSSETGEDFSITLSETEAAEFMNIWKDSEIAFAPMSIERIEDSSQDSYVAQMKDKFSLDSMWNAVTKWKDSLTGL